MSDIFTQEFQKINVNIITQALIEKGYFVFERAITEQAIESIERDSSESRLNFNDNKISGVYYEKQYYLTNLLCVSKTFYDFVTSRRVFEICNKYLGGQFRLKAMRYYETFGGHHMRWHTDNKSDRGFTSIPGVIFIFYVSDVTEGEFQYIEGSHNWSGEKAYSEYSDEFIETNHKSKIKDFKLPRGSLIVYNTYGIHRAKPVLKNKFIRKSVFFQVDGDINNSEPIYLNTEFISKVDRQLEMFLGFGSPAQNAVFPQTSLSTLPLTRSIFYIFLKYIPRRLMRYAFDHSPKFVKNWIRKLHSKHRS